MAKVIAVMGESGSGKTTSMQKLDSKTTFYIDADKKGLSWKGWRQQYVLGQNYARTDDLEVVKNIFKQVSEKKNWKVLIIDTINSLMIADEMKRSKEKGYDKWVDLATCVWDLVVSCYDLRDDLTVVFTAHTQTEIDDAGYRFTRIQTSGKKLNKIVLESKFTTVLLSKSVDGKYLFETRANNSTAKTPKDAFEDFEIENDITTVIKALEEY